jgi:hypothetical protein
VTYLQQVQRRSVVVRELEYGTMIQLLATEISCWFSLSDKMGQNGGSHFGKKLENALAKGSNTLDHNAQNLLSDYNNLKFTLNSIIFILLFKYY